MAGAGRGGKKDPVTWAIPLFFLSMAIEYRHNKKKAATNGTSGGTYERRDTAASLTMGTLSTIAPLVLPRLLRPITPGRGRYATHVIGATAVAAAAATLADRVSATKRRRGDDPSPAAERIASVAGTAATSAGLVSVATGWAALTSIDRLWRRRLLTLGSGPLAWAVALLGWDFIYYWNHRSMHERRFLWSVHVVHHSSEHYNLSTALRQTVSDTFGVFIPYSALCLLGVSPELVLASRGINLIYQYWIHTEAIDRLGRAETVLNSPAAHRVHHGVNPQYIDRNHGGILITWDRIFGTFTEEEEPPTYGLTENISSFSPWVIATHEYRSMLSDLSMARSWSDRLGFLLKGPGWAKHRRRELDARALASAG